MFLIFLQIFYAFSSLRFVEFLMVVSYFSNFFQLLHRVFLWNETAENLYAKITYICRFATEITKMCMKITLISKSKHIFTREFFDFQFCCFLTILERALRALASSSGGAACTGATRGQPRGSTPGVRGWFQGNLSKKKFVTDGLMNKRTNGRTEGRTDLTVEIMI